MRRSKAILRNHHILSQRFEDRRAFDGLDKQALGVHAQRNQIYLPAGYELARNMGVSPHPGGHVPLYYKAVARTLDKLLENHPNPDIRAAEIEALIDAMRAGLVNGDLYTNVPLGKTLEEVNRGIERVVDGYTTYRASNLDRVQAIRDLEQKGAKAGHDHLGRWSAVLGNATREKLLSEAIRTNPRLNITSGNKDLAGTPWQQKFMATDDDFRVPGSEPVNPTHVPQLRGFIPSPPQEFAPEGFTRSDPRLTYGSSGFPAASADWQRFGQLPPSTATPSMPQMLQFNQETGQQMFLSDGSPMLGPNPYEMPHDPNDPSPLVGLGLFAAAMAAPALLPTLPAWVWGLGALGAAGAAAGSSASARPSTNFSGGVFATGAPPYNPFSTGVASNANSNVTPLLGTQSGMQSLTDNARDQESVRSGPFGDRFGNWPGSATAVTPSQSLGNPLKPTATAGGVAAPEDVRRLTRVNASNAASVFESGSAPVPYLPSPEFDDRFGKWRDEGIRPRQGSGPIGAFADDPGHVIQPPIWGSESSANPRNDAEEWFSRWIRPLLRQD